MDQVSDDLQPRMARGMLWVTLGLIFSVRMVSGISDNEAWSSLVVAMIAYPPLIAILARRWRPSVRYGLVAAQAVACLAPFAVIGTDWDWMPWPLAVAVLCAFPRRLAWLLFAVILAGVAACGVIVGFGVYDEVWYLIVTADDALIIFGLHALVAMVTSLHATRGELARLSLVRERVRMDGELREILGGKLQAIAFRLRRAERADPELARGDLREASETARSTLAAVRTIAGAERTDPFAEVVTPIETPRIARLVVLAVLLIQCVLIMLNVTYGDADDRIGVPARILTIVGLLALVTLFLVRPTRPVLIAQGLLILVPLIFIPGSWDRVLSFLTGAILIRMRPPRSWILAALTLAGHFWLTNHTGGTGIINNLESVVAQVIIAWWLFGLARLTGLITLLDQARHELAQTAVFGERMRVAADLHDVLGFSLSAVAMKGELAERLLDRDVERSKAESRSLVVLVDQALAELAAISGDRVRLRVSDEVDAARDLLATAGIATVIEVQPIASGESTQTALATVLREAVTNVLRHSSARSVAITITGSPDAVRLRVVNDGVGDLVPRQGGSGLRSLDRRTGGQLLAGPRAGGEFEVVAEFADAASDNVAASDPARLGRDPDRVDPVATV